MKKSLLSIMNINHAERFFNFIELTGIFFMLLLCFVFQIVLHELPCPLCLLQRLGFLCVALGFMMNLRFGLRPSHYAISILSALFTGFVALRQIALHVIPGTGSYGAAFLGMHLYTWSFIISMVIVVVTTIMLGFDRQYHQRKIIKANTFTHVLFALLFMFANINLIAVLFECGLTQCPDNPTHYL